MPNIQGLLLVPCRHQYVFYSDLFVQKSYSLNLLRLYTQEFLSEFFNTCNIDNRQYELYIGMTAFMQLFIVRGIQLFNAK